MTQAEQQGGNSPAGVTPAARIGPYEVVAALGAGGMGEVLRARDTKLGREVAIKVLPAAFAQDAERVARFRREAQILAALNHPNIAAIHGLEESEGTLALVMELVDGEDLAQRLKRGAIPVDEAIAIAKQIAEALEEAHEHGIVHRDLKPANVKVTPDGKVKVLDFGLAKAFERADPMASSGSHHLSQSPTLAGAGTMAGVILGTAAYMSPEQARGKAVDKRADVWSFGVVVWEMLTGQKLFTGETVSDVLAAVLTRDTLASLPAATPAPVRALLRRCLERDPRLRLRDIGEARLVLADPGRMMSGAEAGSTPAPTRASRVPWVAAALGIVFGGLGFVRARPTPATAGETLRVTVTPAGADGELDGFPAVSPDGRTLAFEVVPASGVSRLWTLSLTTGESRALPDTEYGTEPFWSPDGRFVAYFARGKLRRLELATGLSRALAEASDPRGGAWSEAGIVFSPNSTSGLFQVSPDGSAPRPLTVLDETLEESHRYPTPLPGGQALVFSSMGREGSKRDGLFWYSIADRRYVPLAPETTRSAYDPRGYLLWIRNGTLVAQSFEAATGAVAGEPFPVAERVGEDDQRNGKGWFDAASGVVASRAGEPPVKQLRWYDRAGTVLADVTSPGLFTELALSPDGTQVTTQHRAPGESGRGAIWIFDAAGKDRGRRLTFGGATTSDAPTWSPDGRSVLFVGRGPGGSLVLRKRADGSGQEETLYVHPQGAYLNAVSPREPLAALETYDRVTGEDVWLLPLDGLRKARPFLSTPAAEGHASFSPDGRLLLYSSDESGISQVYAKEIGGSGDRWQLTTAGGDQAAWSADGREIFYVGFDRVLRALPVRRLSPLVVGDAAVLFKLPIPALSISGFRSSYVPSPDGRRFLVNATLTRPAEPGLRLILNWAPPGSVPR